MAKNLYLLLIMLWVIIIFFFFYISGASKYVCEQDVLQRQEWIDIIKSIDSVR